MRNVLLGVIFFMSLGLFIIGLGFSSIMVVFISTLLIMVHNILYALKYVNKRSIFLLFQITLFAFLLGLVTTNMIKYHDMRLGFTENINMHVIVLIFICFLFVFAGQYLGEKSIKKTFNKRMSLTKNQAQRRNNIRFVSKILFYIFYIPYIVVCLEKVIFTLRNGYVSYYLSFQSVLPGIVPSMANVTEICLFVFLATMPSKKEVRIPLLLFILYGILSLGYGQRNPLALNILVVIAYFMIRNHTDEKKWLGKKELGFGILAFTTLPIFFYLFSYIRMGQTTETFSIMDAFIGFFEQIGSSAKVLGYGKIYDETLTDQFYSLGSIIYYIKYNTVIQMFFDFETYKPHTAEMGLNSVFYNHAITYAALPQSYLIGFGLGSSYVAEVYNDFGYIGAIVINLIYGFIFARIVNVNVNKIVVFSLSLIAIKELLYSPRNYTFSFISEMFSIPNLVMIFLIFIIASLLEKRYLMVKKNRSSATMKC